MEASPELLSLAKERFAARDDHGATLLLTSLTEDGLAVADFEHFGATVRTLKQFLEADAALDALVRDVLVAE